MTRVQFEAKCRAAVFWAIAAGGELGFGLFVLWTEFWFRRELGEQSAGTAARR